MKRIFLTGASSGIGRATLELLTASGHEVWGTSRSRERVPRVPRAHAVELDLAEAASVEKGFRLALAEAGTFDVVINNAGAGHFDAAEKVPGEVLERQFRILVAAQIQLCQLALASFKAPGRGLLINVTSLAARLPVPGMSAYNAAKSAMAAYTATLQVELGDSSIRVVDLQPADIRTSFNDAISPAADSPLRRLWAAVDKNMRTAPGPEIVARAILELIESDSPPPRVTVGDFFQARVAPLLHRLLPQRVQVWALRRYYKI